MTHPANPRDEGRTDAVDLLECSSCGNLGIGRGTMTCCDRPMRAVAGEGGVLGEPSLEGLLRTVFGMSVAELDVCLCVMAGGGLTVRELAERTDFDRSSVSRHLRHLVDLGVLEKRRQLLKRGGHVYVYRPTDPETIRRRFRDAFLRWVADATALIDDLSREKVEAIVEEDADSPQWRIYKNEP